MIPFTHIFITPYLNRALFSYHLHLPSDTHLGSHSLNCSDKVSGSAQLKLGPSPAFSHLSGHAGGATQRMRILCGHPLEISHTLIQGLKRRVKQSQCAIHRSVRGASGLSEHGLRSVFGAMISPLVLSSYLVNVVERQSYHRQSQVNIKELHSNTYISMHLPCRRSRE
jgi:hypothetical protein